MELTLRPERRLVTRSGGNRYVDVELRPESPALSAFDLIYAVDARLVRRPKELARSRHVLSTLPAGCSASGVVMGQGAHVLPSLDALVDVPTPTAVDLRRSWLEACLTQAADDPPRRPQHCLLVTEADPELDDREASEVWEHAWITTSLLATQPSTAWKRWCRRAGGYLFRRSTSLDKLTVGACRAVLEIQVGPGVEVQILGHHRGQRDGAVVVGDVPAEGRHVLLSLHFPARPTHLMLRVRARSRWMGVESVSAWSELAFEAGEGPELADTDVMRRVAAALARVAPVQTRPPALRTGDSGDGSGTLVGRFVPATAKWASPRPVEVQRAVLVDSCRGCLVWAGVASALGKGLEGVHPATIRSRFGEQGVQHLEPWVPGAPETAGMVSGDIQVLQEVGESLVQRGGHFDPEDFAVRLVGLLPRNRGIGNAAVEAAHALMQGQPWYQSGLAANSAGNGAAMRVAPVGLASATDENLIHLYRDAVLSALPSHTHPIGVAAAVVMAAAVGHCLRLRLSGQALEPMALLEFVAGLIRPIEREAVRERRPGGTRVRFSERLLEVGSLLTRTPEDAFQVLWNGSFALESVPAALYCFLRTPEDPRQAVLVAVNGGFDADTVGSMTGQLAGVWNGARRLQKDAPAWWDGLEARSELLRLADQLAELALGRYTVHVSGS